MRKRLTIHASRHSAYIKSFISGTSNFVSLPTVTENLSFCKAYQPSLPFAKELQKHYEVGFSLTHPSDFASCNCVTTYCADRRPNQTCQVFGINCLKLEELKQGDPNDLLFSSKALRSCIKSERKNFGVVLLR